MPQLKIVAQKIATRIMPFLMYHNYLASYSKEVFICTEQGFNSLRFFFFFFFFLNFGYLRKFWQKIVNGWKLLLNVVISSSCITCNRVPRSESEMH